MSSYGSDANITGKLIKPAEQWFWWYSVTSTSNFQYEWYIPISYWTLSTANSTGTSVASAASVLTSTDGTANGQCLIVFPFKGKYTISFTVPFNGTAANAMAWWTVNTGYDAVGNTSPIRYNLGWQSPRNTAVITVTFTGIFNAGDKVYPTVYSSALTNLASNSGQRFSMSVVLDYRCA